MNLKKRVIKPGEPPKESKSDSRSPENQKTCDGEDEATYFTTSPAPLFPRARKPYRCQSGFKSFIREGGRSRRYNVSRGEPIPS